MWGLGDGAGSYPLADPFTAAGQPVSLFKLGPTHLSPGQIIELFSEQELTRFYLAWMERSLQLQVDCSSAAFVFCCRTARR